MDISPINATPVSTIVQNTPSNTGQHGGVQPQQVVEPVQKVQPTEANYNSPVGSSIDIYV
ncbi:hypothetical protein GTH32_07110 [Alteromonas sp. 345S023]|uniref:Uncharacterized protein n=1 Tax=Alteromonas profundi TaxID=2696062 RepID=A0A7X5RKK0_9ALTE|nr:hypothetical protein [Alteromonas profundi]NDV90962.1 hypothetical protein [Alteromonas profundi]